MKKRKLNGFLAVLLAASMVIGQPMSAYATEAAPIPVETNEEAEETTNPESAEAGTGETVTGDTLGETGTEDTGTDETTTEDTEAAETTEETGTGETAEETGTEGTAEETTEEETGTEEASEETAPEETETGDQVITDDGEISEKALKDLGFHTMSLSPSMVVEKEELYQVAATMSVMESGKDYVENEVVYLAQDEEEAKRIAECYGGTLEEYEYGVAVAHIQATVTEAVRVAANVRVSLPAVYPNILYHINDGWETGTSTETETPEQTGELIDEADVEHEVIGEVESNGLDLPHDDEHLYATAPNDTYFDKQWHHDAIHTVEAWNATKGQGIIVAVIDSGIDYEHPDLKGNIVGHISTITGDNGDGRDDNGHGTHCAGIIAAIAGNGTGVSGIAPEAKIYSVKALNARGSGSTADIVQGVISAINRNDVDVISMSLGGIYWDSLFQKAIDTAVSQGIVVVAAAGNEAVDQKSYPAAYNNVISVAASDSYNDLVSFSNYGKWVDIAAPGLNILSTVPTDFQIPSDGFEYEAAGYGYMSGTSMACPTVAGTVALMLGNNENLKNNNKKATVTKLTKTLVDSAEPDGTYDEWTNDFYPFLDAEAATYAVDDSQAAVPTIKFSSTPSNKNVVLAGKDQYFELETATPHAKIYYTLNGKKPTPKTGYLYTGKIYMPTSGKVKIQAITAVGSKVSKVFTKTYTFDVKAEALSATSKKDMTVAIGKSIQLSVDIAPSYVSNKKLKWESSDATGMIRVDQKGKVTCKKTAAEGLTATIKATTTDNTNLSYEFSVKAVGDKVENITLNETALNMSYWADNSNVSMKDASGKTYTSTFRLIPSSNGVQTDQYLYKSSNTKVATVDANGNITALGKGKATITVTANDGSGKKATCKVNVVTPVFHIYMYSSTGFSGDSTKPIPIGTGCNITMKTMINYDSSNYLYKPNNKGLEWTSDKPDLVKVKNGKVTCGKDTPIGTEVTITAKAKDGFGGAKSVKFVVTDKIKKMIYVNEKNQSTNSSAVSCKMDVGDGILDLLTNEASPDYVGIVTEHDTDDFYNSFAISTTNRDVVYRMHYYQGNKDLGMVIWGTKPGSSKVVYTARDGSNTKFTINFKITQPK